MAQNIVELGDSAEAKDMIEGLREDMNVMLGSYIRSQLILSALPLAGSQPHARSLRIYSAQLQVC